MVVRTEGPSKRLSVVPPTQTKAKPSAAGIGAHRGLRELPTADWKESAACKGMGTELFFPGRGSSGPSVQKARDICRDCPVRPECFTAGLQQHEGGALEHGIWGGYSQPEREVMIGLRHRGPLVADIKSRIRRLHPVSPELVSVLVAYRGGELPWQGQPPEGSAA